MINYIFLLLATYCLNIEANVFEIVVHKYEALSYREIVDMENSVYKFSFCLCRKETKTPDLDENCECQMRKSGKTALESAPKAIYSASCLHNPEDDKCLFGRMESKSGKYIYIKVEIGNRKLTDPEWQSLNLAKKKRTAHLAAKIDSRLMKLDYITYTLDSENQEISSEEKSKQGSGKDSKFTRFQIKTTFRTSTPLKNKDIQPTTTPSSARRMDTRISTTPIAERRVITQTTTTPVIERKSTAKTSITLSSQRRVHTQTTTTPVIRGKSAAKTSTTSIAEKRVSTQTTTTTLSPPIKTSNSIPMTSFIMPGGDPQGRFIQSLNDATLFLHKLGKIQKVPPMAFNVPEFRKAMLIMHNRFRYAHGVQMVVNDFATEIAAQSWANKLAEKETCLTHEHRKGFGENLFYFAADYLTDPYSMAEAVVRTFYSEGKGYNYRRFRRHHFAVGHFTQMIWGSSTKIGVGVSIKRFSGRRTNGCQPKRATYMMYIVVKYSPAGNVQTQKDYLVNVRPVMRKL
ncbi:hypothetical protein FO519_000763 [Halicephalobus sp. NKZ332]|nr:hypothetical protein FO519_000763 [Halicephalobus sp. NKZ332]